MLGVFEQVELGTANDFGAFGAGDGEDAVFVDISRAAGFDFDENEFALIVEGNDIEFAEVAMPALIEYLSPFARNPLGDQLFAELAGVEGRHGTMDN